MKIQLDNRFIKKLKGIFERFEFEVGILNDTKHKIPQPAKKGKMSNLKSYAGGPARKTSFKSGDKNISDISNTWVDKENYLIKPIRNNKSDIIKFSKEFIKSAIARTQPKRVINLLQAIIRNPILRGDYGSNTPETVKRKGFNRYMIDTGQFFKAITAKVRIKHV